MTHQQTKVVIGEVTQPWGNGGAFFREVVLVQPSELTVRGFIEFGASISRSGALVNAVFRGNTGSAVGIDGTNVIRQILHLTGHEQHPESFTGHGHTAEDIQDLFGCFRPMGTPRL